jgi:hypothetical protein
MSTVNITTTNNTVSIQDINQTISITDNNQNTTTVIPQPTVNIVEVNTPGPQGPQGPSINTSSFATTGSNIFIGNQSITGSLNILGSSYINNRPVSYGLFAQTGSSLPITNTTIETSILDGGIGTLSVPANGFQIGDSFHAKLFGHLTCNNNVTLQFKIKTANIILADTGLITLNAVTDRRWNLDIFFTIRALGPAGIASIISGGVFTYVQNSGGATQQGTDFSVINSTTFDTTVSNTLNITAQWGTSSSGNIIYSELFTLTKIT